mmetsp:Transcript_13463/g.30961  ORF Transcript_13463/g.30961 Transcript_13463/m.30961 type:complete len:259 (-) Transcript_13463:2118-2894(-)
MGGVAATPYEQRRGEEGSDGEGVGESDGGGRWSGTRRCCSHDAPPPVCSVHRGSERRRLAGVRYAAQDRCHAPPHLDGRSVWGCGEWPARRDARDAVLRSGQRSPRHVRSPTVGCCSSAPPRLAPHFGCFCAAGARTLVRSHLAVTRSVVARPFALAAADHSGFYCPTLAGRRPPLCRHHAAAHVLTATPSPQSGGPGRSQGTRHGTVPLQSSACRSGTAPAGPGCILASLTMRTAECPRMGAPAMFDSAEGVENDNR